MQTPTSDAFLPQDKVKPRSADSCSDTRSTARTRPLRAALLEFPRAIGRLRASACASWCVEPRQCGYPHIWRKGAHQCLAECSGLGRTCFCSREIQERARNFAAITPRTAGRNAPSSGDGLPPAAGPLRCLQRTQGRCTCGCVRFSLTSNPLIVRCCPCSWRQRETGSASVINALIEADRVIFLHGTPESPGACRRIFTSPRRLSCRGLALPAGRSTTGAASLATGVPCPAAGAVWLSSRRAGHAQLQNRLGVTSSRAMQAIAMIRALRSCE
jgi:hypothetical protein